MIIRFGTLPSLKSVEQEAKQILESGIDPPVITDRDLLDMLIANADDSVVFVGPNGHTITKDVAWSIRYEGALDLIRRETEKPAYEGN